MSYPIKGFLETSFVDWPGKVASVIFLPQCNFRCPYCYNHELVLNPDKLSTFPFDHIIHKVKRYRNWVDGICITGGEPTLLPDLVQLIECLRSEQLQIKLDTNGSYPEVLARLIDGHLVDHVSMDVKAPLNQQQYSRCCGVSVDLEKVRESIGLLKERLPSYEFRITVVPSLHTREDLLQLAEELKGSMKLTLKNYNPVSPLDPQLKTEHPYSDREIEELQEEVNHIL